MKRSLLTGLLVAVLAGLVSAATVYDVYRVQPGDTVESVARTYNISLAELQQLNPNVANPLSLHEVLTVPIRAAKAGTPSPAGSSANNAGGAVGANGVNTAGSVVGGATGPKVLDGNGRPEGALAAPAPAAQPPAVAPAAQAQASGPIRLSYAVNGALGRLGEVSGAQVPIYRDRQQGGARMYTAPQGTRMLVVSRVDNWFGIRMLDGSIGWAEAEFVKLSDTELLPAPGSGSAPSVGVAILQTAFEFLGVPYVWGGESKRGIDCSGLVLRAYGAHGIDLPRTAHEQITVGRPVPAEELQPGDRIYFSSDGDRIDHTGMYIGNGKFIHASGRRRQVCIDELFDSRYWSIYAGARR